MRGYILLTQGMNWIPTLMCLLCKLNWSSLQKESYILSTGYFTGKLRCMELYRGKLITNKLDQYKRSK